MLVSRQNYALFSICALCVLTPVSWAQSSDGPMPGVIVLDSQEHRRQEFALGEIVTGSVLNPNGSRTICHQVANLREASELFRGEGLQVERQTGGGWERVGVRGFIDEPSFRNVALPATIIHQRKWRTTRAGVYRFKFTFSYSQSSGICSSSPSISGVEVAYSPTFLVRAGAPVPPPLPDSLTLEHIDQIMPGPLQAGRQTEFVATIRYQLSTAEAGFVGLYADLFDPGAGACGNSRAHHTVASERVDVGRGSGTIQVHLTWTLGRSPGFLGLGTTLWTRSGQFLTERHDALRDCYQIAP